MKKTASLIVILFIFISINSTENNSVFSQINKEKAIVIAEGIRNDVDIQDALSNYGEENSAERIMDEISRIAGIQIDQLGFGEYCAFMNIVYLLESHNIELGNLAAMSIKEPVNDFSAFDIISSEIVAGDEQFSVIHNRYLYETLQENDREAVLCFLGICAIGGVVGGTGNLIGLGFEYGFDIDEIPFSEIVGSFSEGFVIGFVATGLGMLSGTVLPVVGALPATAAGLLADIMSVPGFEIGLADCIDSFLVSILGPVANWSIFDFYNPASYIELFSGQDGGVNSSLLSNCNDAFSEFYNEYPNIDLNSLSPEGNAHLIQTWTFDGDEDFSMAKEVFSVNDYVNWGMSLSILEPTTASISMNCSNGSSDACFASGSFSLGQGQFIVEMTEPYLSQNIINALGISGNYYVEGSVSTTGENAITCTINSSDNNSGLFHITDVVISGYVKTNAQIPIEDALINISNSNDIIYTDAYGYYECPIPYWFWSGTVTPTKLNHTFDPMYRTYSGITSTQNNQDYTGTYTPSEIPPTIQVLSPNNIQAYQSCIIEFQASDPDSDAEIYFYYDNNSYGHNGLCINPESPVHEDYGSTAYSWNLDDMNPGVYWVYARITDGTYNNIYDYSPGTVEKVETESGRSLRIDDEIIESSDDDEWAEIGESIDYELFVENRSDETVYDVDMTLVCETSDIVMIDDTYSVSSIASDHAVSPNFYFNIPNNFSDDEAEFVLQVIYEDSNGLPYSQTLHVRDVDVFPSTLIPPYFTIEVSPENQCCSINNSVTYYIETQPIDSQYNHAISLSGSSTSGHILFEFNDTEILPGNSTAVTISNDGSLEPGMYEFTISGTTSETQRSTSLEIEFVESTTVNGGNVSGYWSAAASPYFVEGDITVPAGEFLEIEAGTEVQFRGSYALHVYGTLLTMGSETGQILFTCNDTGTGWKGIRMYDTADESRLNYTTIQYAKSTNNGGGLFLDDCDAIISNCYIHHNYLMANNTLGAGVYTNEGTPVFINTTISENSSTYEVESLGMCCSSPEAMIIGCRIINNQNMNDNQRRVGGLYIRGGDKYNESIPIVANTIIANNRVGSDAGGMRIGGAVEFVNCVIANNHVEDNDDNDNGGGIYKKGSKRANFYNSIIYGNSTNGNIGHEVYVDPEDGALYFEYCSIRNRTNSSYVYGPVSWGPGNITSSPGFDSNYAISSSSGCIDAGNPNMIDALIPPGLGESRADMGAFGGEANGVFENRYLVTPIIADFHMLNIGFSREKVFHVYNLTENVAICSIESPDNQDITVSESFVSIDPYSKVEVIVNWTPTITGSMNEVIVFDFEGVQVPKSIFGESLNSGNLESDVYGILTISHCPYHVVGDIVIPYSQELIIDPGVQLLFDGNYKIDVYGSLIANGTENEQVTITREGSNTWKGIRFHNSNGNTLNHTNLSNANKVLVDDYDDIERQGAALHLISSELGMRGCHIHNNKSAARGGALFVDELSFIRISDCLIENNCIYVPDFDTYDDETFGGAIYFDHSEAVIENTTFNSNYIQGDYSTDNDQADLEGGAIWCNASAIDINNCNFINNMIESSYYDAQLYGGAINAKSSTVNISSCSFVGNHLNMSAVNNVFKRVEGGAICNDSGADINVLNSYFEGNYAVVNDANPRSRAYGGAIEDANIVIGCTFIGNYVDAGQNCKGGACRNGDYTRNIFINNHAGDASDYSEGGAIDSGDNLYNNLFINNCTGPAGISWGGAIDGGSPIINNVFYGNHTSGSTGYGGAIRLSNGTIYNNVMYNNQSTHGDQISGYTSEGNTYEITVDYNLIENLASSAFAVTDFITIGEHNFDSNPLFADINNNDFHLLSSSPCIDAGHPEHYDNVLADSLGLGTILCDLGVYGGINNSSTSSGGFLQLCSPELSFGDTFVNESDTLYVTISLIGQGGIAIDSIRIEQSVENFHWNYNSRAIVSENNPVTLAVIHEPINSASNTGTMKIYSSNPFGTLYIALTGNGIAPNIVLDSSVIDFGDVRFDSTAIKPLLISNDGTGYLQVESITPDSSQFVVSPQQFVVPVSESKEVHIEFNPSFVGEITSSCLIQSNDADTTYTIIANVTKPEIEMSEDACDFDWVECGTTSSINLTIFNIGTAVLHLNEISTTGDVFSADVTDIIINPGETSTLTISFTPEECVEYSSLISIETDDETARITVNGYGYNVGYSDISSQSGLDISDNTRGVCWTDFDMDGYQDVFVANYNSASRIFFNDGNGIFTDFTAMSMIDISGPAYSASWADYDNDGDPDIYVTLYNQSNILLVNEGDYTFSDFSSICGANDSGPSKGSSWADFDKDGYVDLFVANYGSSNKLFRNNGDGTFSDVTDIYGVNYSGQSQIGIWADCNEDGYEDLFVCNWNNEPNLLYINNLGESFTETGEPLEIQGADKSKSAMWSDFDNDGDFDLIVSNWLNQENNLFRNDFNSSLGFIDVMQSTGIDLTTANYSSLFLDYDNNGWEDILIFPWTGDHCHLCINNGDGSFIDRTNEGGLDLTDYIRSVTITDIDQDGYPDLYCGTDSGNNIMLKNMLSHNNWIGFTLTGFAKNLSSIGTRITLYSNDQIQTKMLDSGEIYMSSNANQMLFGLGAHNMVDSIVIKWQGMHEETYTNLMINQYNEITEPNSAPFFEFPEYFEVAYYNSLNIDLSEYSEDYTTFDNQLQYSVVDSLQSPSGQYNLTDAILLYSAPQNWFGLDTLIVEIHDGIFYSKSPLVFSVAPDNYPPQITSHNPAYSTQMLTVGSMTDFSVNAEDTEGDPIQYRWCLNETLVSTTNTYTFNADMNMDGMQHLKCSVSQSDSTRVSISNTELNSRVWNPYGVSEIEWNIYAVNPYDYVISPNEESLVIAQPDTVSFLFDGYSSNGYELEYDWKLEYIPVSSLSTYTFHSDSVAPGNYIISLDVSEIVPERRRLYKEISRENATRNSEPAILNFVWQVEVTGGLLPPQNIIITCSENSVTISWDTVFEASSYKIWANDAPDVDTDSLPIAHIAATSYTIPQVEEMKYFVIRASDESISAARNANAEEK